MIKIAIFLALVSTARAQSLPTTLLAWLDIPNTKLSGVCPTFAQRPDLFGPNIAPQDCHTITAQWGGGTWDETDNRLIIAGGGHGTYYGDEPYAVDLNSQQILQLAPPPPQSVTGNAPGNCTAMAPNHPGGRHTNDNLAWVDHLGVLVMVGGAGECTAGSVEQDLWVWNAASKSWSDQQPDLRASNGFCAQCGGTAAGVVYDVNKKRVWFHDCWTTYEYIAETNAVINHSHADGCIFSPTFTDYYTKWIFDSKRNRYIGIGLGMLFVTDLTQTSNFVWTNPSASGDTTCEAAQAPGFAYDPVQDKYVCWHGGNTVYLLDPVTWAWSTVSLSGTAPTMPLSDGGDLGTYGRLQYSKTSNAFVYYGDWQHDAAAFRLTAPSRTGVMGPAKPQGLTLR